MQIIPLQVLPNQALSVILDNNQWDFVIKVTRGIMTVSLQLNSVDILDSAAAVAGSLIIPSLYKESGNFMIVTQSFQLPDYTQFGTTQFLIYYSADDLAAFRAPITPPIKAANFNPIAALPLRFSPQNYVEA